MSLLTDIQFAGRVSVYVRNFKQKGDFIWNFSCPICGDSKKKRGKARGYLYRVEDRLLFKCHNCELPPMSLGRFFQHLDETLYKEYIVASAIERNKGRAGRPKKGWKEEIRDMDFSRPVVVVDPFAGLPTLASLPDDHPAKAYIVNRKIPNSFLDVLLYAEDFAAVVDKWKPNGPALVHEPRIIIPFRNRKRILAIQGRSLEPEAALRYITIKADDDTPKIFGLDRIDLNADRIYVLEGPFDSMFLPNALAMAGADLPKILPKHKTIVVYDDEPHNAEIVAKMDAAIRYGYRVCIWPRRQQNTGRKDINQMVLDGQTPEEIRQIIEENSYSGTAAKMWLTKWRRDDYERRTQQNRSNRNRIAGN